jgi:hypothetical protein
MRSASPRPPVEPQRACSVNSVAGSPALGPVRPKGVIATTTLAGCAARNAATSDADTAASTMTTSAAAASART